MSFGAGGPLGGARLLVGRAVKKLSTGADEWMGFLARKALAAPGEIN